MKREILCEKCENVFSSRLGLVYDEHTGRIIDPYPGEHIKIVGGKSTKPMLCDQCATYIATSEKCFAVSIWTDFMGHIYYPWESEYLYADEDIE